MTRSHAQKLMRQYETQAKRYARRPIARRGRVIERDMAVALATLQAAAHPERPLSMAELNTFLPVVRKCLKQLQPSARFVVWVRGEPVMR